VRTLRGYQVSGAETDPRHEAKREKPLVRVSILADVSPSVASSSWHAATSSRLSLPGGEVILPLRSLRGTFLFLSGSLSLSFSRPCPFPLSSHTGRAALGTLLEVFRSEDDIRRIGSDLRRAVGGHRSSSWSVELARSREERLCVWIRSRVVVGWFGSSSLVGRSYFRSSGQGRLLWALIDEGMLRVSRLSGEKGVDWDAKWCRVFLGGSVLRENGREEMLILFFCTLLARKWKACSRRGNILRVWIQLDQTIRHYPYNV